MTYLKSFIDDSEGQDLVEYGLLLLMIAVACVAGLGPIGTALKGFYSSAASKFP